MPILGLFGTGEFTTEQRPTNWRSVLLKVDPNGDAPMTALTSMMKTESTDDPTYNWFYQGFEPRILNVSNGGGHTNADTTINLGSIVTATTPSNSGLYTRVGTLVLVPETGEIMRCSANGTASTITVVGGRGFAGTTAQAIPDGAQLTIIGTAHAEGSGSQSGLARVPVHLYNYTQIFKTPVEHTRTAAKTKTRTPDQIQADRAEALSNHMVDIERTLLFGRRSLSTGSNGKPLRTTGGLQQFVTTNIQDLGGAGTLSDLDDYFKELFKFGKMTRIGWVGNDFIQRLNQLVADNAQYQFGDTIKVYGMNLKEFVTPYGTCYFRRHPVLSTDPFYTNSAWFISPENIVYRYIDDTTLQENIQNNDEDLKKDQYLTECGMEIHLEETHGILTNL